MRLFVKTEIPKIPLFSVSDQADVIFKSTLGSFFKRVKTEGVAVAKQETPVGASGRLADSVLFKRVSFFEASIKWTAPYSQAVASGSRPHFAPIRRLSEWTALRWGDYGAGKLLQEIIKTKGTAANNFPLRTKKRVDKIAKRLWPQKMSEFVRRIIS